MLASSSRLEKSVFPPVHDFISFVSSKSSEISFELPDNEYADGSICRIRVRSAGSGALRSSIGNAEWNNPHSGHLNVPLDSRVPHDGQRTEASSRNNGSELKLIPRG